MLDGFHFGEPLRHGGCVGETMNCEDLRVVEAWEQEKEHYKWMRRGDLEKEIPYWIVARGIITANEEAKYALEFDQVKPPTLEQVGLRVARFRSWR
jgi:hypothetical protein